MSRLSADQLCKNCVFYKQRSAVDGECRRQPPAPVPGAEPNRLWPDVMHSDWCGEFFPHYAPRRSLSNPDEQGPGLPLDRQ